MPQQNRRVRGSRQQPALPSSPQDDRLGCTHKPATAGRNGNALIRPVVREGSPVPWKKVLYEEQPYSDNYTDATFLQQLVVNDSVPERGYWQVVRGAVAVVQQISATVAVAIACFQLHEGLLSPFTLCGLCVLLLLLLSATCVLGGERIPGGSVKRALRQVALLTTGVYLLSPTYASLSRTVSTDTVIFLAVVLLLLHLYFYDYQFVNNVTERLTGTVSLAAAVFASVLLSSRLKADLQVFAHLMFSLQLFLLSPYLRRYIRKLSFSLHVLVTVAMFSLTAWLLHRLSPVLLVVHSAGSLFVCFGAPFWLIRIHKFKAKINGPWDEAVPTMSLDL